MQHYPFRRAGRWVGVFAVAAATFGAFSLFSPRSGAQPAAPATGYPGASTESLISLGFKFDGAQTCASAKCHGGTEQAKNGPPFNNEFTLWSGGKDPHQKAFEQMTGAKGKAIFDKYKALNPAGAGADLASSQRCLTCHALKVPQNLQGKQYTVDEGVGCNSCHGPSEKWNPVHDKKVGGKLWAEAQLAAAGGDPAKLLKTWGFYYTKPVHARAEKCTSCHLSIDAQMIEAGHPQTMFDLAYYSLTYPDVHWQDPQGYWQVKLWAVGQAVCLREAGTQLAQRASAANTSPEALKSATNQVWGHFMVLSSLPEGKALNASVTQLQQAGTDKAKLAAAGTAISTAAAALIPTLENLNANKASTIAALNALTDNKSLAGLGQEGIEQQRDTIYDLYNALAGSPDKPADSDAVLDLIVAKLFPQTGKPDAASVTAGLAAIKAKLPK